MLQSIKFCISYVYGEFTESCILGGNTVDIVSFCRNKVSETYRK